MKEMMGELCNERGKNRGEGTSQVKNEDDHLSENEEGLCIFKISSVICMCLGNRIKLQTHKIN